MMTKIRDFDPAAYLETADEVQAYLEEAMATCDPVFIADALGVVSRARGMTDIARKSGLSRESLYRALSAEGNPEFSTVLKVLDALGLKLTLTKAA
jgi:probable addiction module antidote protein